ncbi:MAG: hypothetical protein IPP28_12600 [Xanthomonadales bacterium]|nr:hypothetical protein [Xanthomonadales bacterium]
MAAAPIAPGDLMLVIGAKNDEATKAAAARIQSAADAGNSFAMYDVGSLHRQSSRKGAAVFAYDPGKALKWLTRAFDGGRLTAAYKVALTYAAIGDDMEAMGWAQVYTHFVRPTEKRSGRQIQFRLALLNDLYARIGRDREDAIESRLMTLLDKHGPSYEAGVRRNEPRHPDWIDDEDDCKLTELPIRHNEPVRQPVDGLVEYLVEIDTQGRPGAFVALDSAPQAMIERDLRDLVQRLDCKPQRRTRYAFQNFQLQYGSRLRLESD